MLGDKSYLNVNAGQKSGFVGQIQESKFNQILDEKDKEIARLTKTIKRLKRQLKEKEEGLKLPLPSEGNNGHFKILLEREVSRYNELKQVIVEVTERIRKLSQEINSEFSIFQSSESMENLVKMLETARLEDSKSGKSFSSQKSSSIQSEDICVEEAVDQFQVIVRGLMSKYGQTSKLYKDSIQMQKQLQQQSLSYKKELKLQRKSKDLLQKLLQKNETQKNQLVNQINNIATQSEIQQLRSKSKEQIILHYFKLNYRIKELQKQKQDYIKSSTRDKEKQVKMYEALLSQVKGMKERNRIRQSVA